MIHPPPLTHSQTLLPVEITANSTNSHQILKKLRDLLTHHPPELNRSRSSVGIIHRKFHKILQKSTDLSKKNS